MPSIVGLSVEKARAGPGGVERRGVAAEGVTVEPQRDSSRTGKPFRSPTWGK
jgi:hypothetical protein